MRHPAPWQYLVAISLVSGTLGGCDAPVAASGDGGTPAPDAARADAAPPRPDAAGADGGPGVPVFRNPVSYEDRPLAQQALAILGAGSSFACSECHGITQDRIREWRALSDTALGTCLTDLEVSSPSSARTMVDCLRGGSADGAYEPQHAGVFATAARLDWFEHLFRVAFGDEWEAEYTTFVERSGMPPDGARGAPFTQAQFDIIAEWFIRGVPELETFLIDTMPTDCTPRVTGDVATHVAAMATGGWAARNLDNSILMHGCAGATTPRECLSTYPPASSTWDVVPGSSSRVLYTTSYRSSFWTRSSADGRFVGHGGGTGAGSSIIDLQRATVIGVEAAYDPAFFPDNSGFMFMGGGGVCEQSVLTASAPTRITFAEPGCTGNDMVGLYEHVGASLDGGDYWAVHGQFVSDSGGHGRTANDPAATFSAGSTTYLTRMINSGSGFVPVETPSFASPNEGDAVISPSSRLLVTRIAGASGQLGFSLRRIDATDTGSGWTIETPEIARYCTTGGKPAFSYDERWLVVHHYFADDDADAIELGFTDASDPGFAEYVAEGAANVYLIDLATGTRTRITNMPPGQYAVFPHFRSDGWIYYMIRSAGGTEQVVASDAALVLAGE